MAECTAARRTKSLLLTADMDADRSRTMDSAKHWKTDWWCFTMQMDNEPPKSFTRQRNSVFNNSRVSHLIRTQRNMWFSCWRQNCRQHPVSLQSLRGSKNSHRTKLYITRTQFSHFCMYVHVLWHLHNVICAGILTCWSRTLSQLYRKVPKRQL